MGVVIKDACTFASRTDFRGMSGMVSTRNNTASLRTRNRARSHFGCEMHHKHTADFSLNCPIEQQARSACGHVSRGSIVVDLVMPIPHKMAAGERAGAHLFFREVLPT